MKKTLTLLFFILSFLTGNAQLNSEFMSVLYNTGHFRDADIEMYKNQSDDNKTNIIRDKHIKEVQKISYSKKNEVKTTETRKYNSLGRVVSIERKDLKVNYVYVNDTLLSKIEKITPKHTRITEQTYEGTLLTSRSFVKDGIKLYTENYQYTDFGKTLKAVIIYHRKKDTYESNYRYNESHKLTYTDFVKNGKTIKTWNYDCLPQGEENIEKTTALASVCKYYEESNDGSYIEYSRRILNKETILQKDYYSKDSLLYKSESFSEDTILISSFTMNNLNTIFEKYDRKGRQIHQITSTYNQDKLLTEYRSIYKERFFYVSRISYNSDNTISEIKKEDKKGFMSKVVFTYVF